MSPPKLITVESQNRNGDRMGMKRKISGEMSEKFDTKDTPYSKETSETGRNQIEMEKALKEFKEGKSSIDEAAESAGVSPRYFCEIMLQALAQELTPGQGDMKLIIFAGGTGTRFWPLSRKRLPKQFKKIFNGNSTLQLAFERIKKAFDISNIYISTNQDYISLVKEQLQDLPADQIIGEPEKRNVGPAVGYILIHLRKKGHHGPVAILWADHLMEHVDRFIEVLRKGEALVRENPQQLVFIGEKPRYAESNLGWIRTGDEIEKGQFKFKEWYYKPPPEESEKMYKSGEWYWNPGYFVVDLEFALCLYRVYAPEMYRKLKEIEENLKTYNEEETIKRVYPQFESISFDRIIEKVPSDYAVVLPTDLGWSDPGTLYAFKEAMVGSGKENYTQGLTKELDTTDSLIINEEEKLVATVGLDGMVVVNTADALLVVHKDKVSKATELIKELEKNEELNQFV